VVTYYVLKVLLSAGLVVLVSELAKRSTLIGGLVASLPLVSLLAMIWLYAETRDTVRVASLSSSIFWLVLPSLVLFLALPVFLNNGLAFALSLALSMAIMLACYGIVLVVLGKLGISL
jgi:hypothetical protein